jgi:Thioredoxin-like proteins and domains
MGQMALENKICDLLEDKVNPRLRSHGGCASFCVYEEGVLHVHMLGQCANCPAAVPENETLIFDELKNEIPGLQRVQIITGVSEELLGWARKRVEDRRGC